MTFEERLKANAERIRKDMVESMMIVTDNYNSETATIEFEDGEVKYIDRDDYRDLYSSYESCPVSEVLNFDEYLYWVFC